MLGILDQPVLHERFVGVNGEAVLLTGTRRTALHVRPCPALAEAVLCATHPDAYFSPAEADAFHRVQRITRMTRFGGDCYLFGLLALGFIDLIVEAGFHHWDAAALIPIIEGAGGIMTNWQGGSCARAADPGRRRCPHTRAGDDIASGLGHWQKRFDKTSSFR